MRRLEASRPDASRPEATRLVVAELTAALLMAAPQMAGVRAPPWAREVALSSRKTADHEELGVAAKGKARAPTGAEAALVDGLEAVHPKQWVPNAKHVERHRLDRDNPSACTLRSACQRAEQAT